MTFMTREEVRHFPIPSGVTVDLISLIGTLGQVPDVERESWVEPAMVSGINIGDVAYVHSYGDYRRGVVTKLGRTRVTVTFTTKGAVDRGVESPTWGTKVTAKSAPLEDIRVYRPATPEPAPVAEVARTLDVSTPLAQSLVEADHAEALELGRERVIQETMAETGETREAVESVLSGLEGMAGEEALEAGPTEEETLKLIGGCWAGGALTGKALKAWTDGDFILAAALATDQKKLQETGGPDALHPDHQTRVTQAETLAEVAQEVLDYVELAPGVAVAPIGTPTPTAEDLSDLALALALEDPEHPEPDATVEPAAPRCQVRDMVTIHRGTRLYEVTEVRTDLALPPKDREGSGLARVLPVDPEDQRDAQWVSMDLLHVRRPVAFVTTEEITERVRQTREVFKLEGPGYEGGAQDLMAVRTILMDSRRLPVATLAAPPLSLAAPVATLRVGESIVVDGRCFAVTLEDTELGWRAHLEPAPHRNRKHLHQG